MHVENGMVLYAHMELCDDELCEHGEYSATCEICNGFVCEHGNDPDSCLICHPNQGGDNNQGGDDNQGGDNNQGGDDNQGGYDNQGGDNNQGGDDNQDSNEKPVVSGGAHKWSDDSPGKASDGGTGLRNQNQQVENMEDKETPLAGLPFDMFGNSGAEQNNGSWSVMVKTSLFF